MRVRSAKTKLKSSVRILHQHPRFRLIGGNFSTYHYFSWLELQKALLVNTSSVFPIPFCTLAFLPFSHVMNTFSFSARKHTFAGSLSIVSRSRPLLGIYYGGRNRANAIKSFIVSNRRRPISQIPPNRRAREKEEIMNKPTPVYEKTILIHFPFVPSRSPRPVSQNTIHNRAQKKETTLCKVFAPNEASASSSYNASGARRLLA